MRRFILTMAFLTMAFLAAPRLVMACPVCFGQSDSPAAAAINLGIFVLLGVIGAVLAAFASFMVYLNRRAKLFAETTTPVQADDLALQGREPQEGTAVC
jgi:hypothetical protein